MKSLFILVFFIPFHLCSQLSAALIPMPQKILKNNGQFIVKDCREIVVTDDSLMQYAQMLQKQLLMNNKYLPIKKSNSFLHNAIRFSLAKVESPINQQEAYQLSVSSSSIFLKANTTHGIFNGLKTLYQLICNDKVDACQIIDWPAFSLRGYMIDVGRNYQSISQIKQQIDRMAAYKLNVFHFHLTEDIAWRLFVEKYPELTRAQNMLRNPGKYYSTDEMKELIAYCKERKIQLIPEIDMPGHSAAFKRAMGVDMQSDSGILICKNILTEICEKYDVSTIHIGGDEVAYSKKTFLKEMISFLKTKNKNVIAWDPGGEVAPGTMLQMWNGKSKPKKGYPAIDSRHLYLNHFDPLEGVVTVFNHQINDLPFGNEDNPGAILCNWPDRNVADEKDLIRMNAVYPIMLAFAERTWSGGGWGNYMSDIGRPSADRYKAFAEFENRLLVHKKRNFQNLPFPYVKQSDIIWKLKGPYHNNGNTMVAFLPEINYLNGHGFDDPDTTLYGGTIILRHFWSPMIGSHLSHFADSSTWYAARTIWSEKDTVKYFWIGFNNYSRSTATQPPPVGQWDDKNSKLWVNGQLITPPIWKMGGQTINLEQPLTDEGYEYRPPVKISLKKGANNVLIKCPVKTFIGKDWQNPVKWMFTFVEMDMGHGSIE